MFIFIYLDDYTQVLLLLYNNNNNKYIAAASSILSLSKYKKKKEDTKNATSLITAHSPESESRIDEKLIV